MIPGNHQAQGAKTPGSDVYSHPGSHGGYSIGDGKVVWAHKTPWRWCWGEILLPPYVSIAFRATCADMLTQEKVDDMFIIYICVCGGVDVFLEPVLRQSRW